MTVHLAVLAFVVDVALGMWLGVMVFFSFIGAPRAHAVFGDEASQYVNDVFPRYYRLGVLFGVVAFVAELFIGSIDGFEGVPLVVLASIGVGTVVAGYSVGVLIPKMEAADESGFEAYHRQSEVLNGVTMLAVVGALIATHLPS